MNPYLLASLPTDRPYTWLLTCDPNKRHGGLLTALDHLGNRFYVAEHYRESIPDSQHAAAYKAMLGALKLRPDRDVACYADPGGAGSQAILNLAEVGIACQPVPKDAGSVKASIERIRRMAWLDPSHPHPVTGRLGAPHLYFLVTLRSSWLVDGVQYHESRLMWELRQYRQKENGKPDEPVKEKDDLVDCMRYVELVRPWAPEMQDTRGLIARQALDTLSRKANDEFDDLVRRSQEPAQPGRVW